MGRFDFPTFLPHESSHSLTQQLSHVVPCIIAQAPHLKAMLDMTGTRKKEACDKLDGFKAQVGAKGIIEIMKCEGAFPKAYKDAKAFCGGGNSSSSTKKPDGPGGHLCNIAKMQVRLYI